MLLWFAPLSVILMILAPIALAAWLRRRAVVPWLLFCAGMLTFAASQAVHLPLNELLARTGWMPPFDTPGVPLWRTALLAGLTAGLCEELARVVGYALLRKARRPVDGLMLGLGHGGLESMVFGGVLTAATITALLPLQFQDLTQMNLLPEQVQAIQQQLAALLSNPTVVLAPFVERLLAIGLHVTFSLMVLQAFRTRRSAWAAFAWVALAIAYHALIDMLAVLFTRAQAVAPDAWQTLGGLFLLALPGYLWSLAVVRKDGLRRANPPSPLAADLRLFWVALRKELLQQWRTRRVLIAAAVLGLFGMSSPLMAYFLPQIMQSIPGAEQFAGLIPEPGANDALVQYVKNLSQFGFLLAILVGIGDVAGEKERGTASMVLSKPLPRWAFVLSKFTAQTALYLVAFLLALAGGLFYTAVLFPAVATGVLLKTFALSTALLLLWLLPFVALTLLASVLARSTGAAAGLAAVFCVALMLLGTLPFLSGLLPGALLGWANQINVAQPLPPANGGALAATLAITVIALVAAVALFENQEL